MPKRPSFQFYPSDWLRDTALRSCSMGARGLWMDMLCYMHEGNPYGYLKVGEKVILPANLARMVGETLEVVEGWLDELKHAGVYDLTTEGVIISRRMIRDENLRKIRAEGGKLGGNPTLMDNDKVNHKDNHKVGDEDKQNPTPSSSSSSSINTQESKPKKGQKPVVPHVMGSEAGFEKFWNAYPRKKGKEAARAAWFKLDFANGLFAQIMTALESQKDSRDFSDPKYIPHPATWLNNKRWNDDVSLGSEDPKESSIPIELRGRKRWGAA